MPHNLSGSYLMHDACNASANALKQVFPEMYFVVCYQSMTSAVEQQIQSFGVTLQNTIHKDVDTLHFSRNYTEFCERVNTVTAKWEKLATDFDGGIVHFKSYFMNQWINSFFNLWQIYNTPPGFATTNQSINMMTSNVKKTLATFNKLSFHECLAAFMVNIVGQHSKNSPQFELKAVLENTEFDRQMRTKANGLTHDMFTRLTHNEFLYTNLQKSHRYHLTIGHGKWCDCACFLEKAKCCHLIAIESFLN
jgi:hypothetical protein